MIKIKECPFCGGEDVWIGDEEAVCPCGCILVTAEEAPGIEGVIRTWNNRHLTPESTRTE